MKHITAHAGSGNLFVAGCTCAWVGPQRSLLQAALTDRLRHERDSAQVAQVAGPTTLGPACQEPGCPICA